MKKNWIRAAGVGLLAVAATVLVNSAAAEASGYYRIQTRNTYNGNYLCLQGNGNLAAVTVATCSTSSRQKWAYYDLNGYQVLANVGYSPSLALDSPTLSGGTTVQLRSIQGNSHQGWTYDSLYNRNGNIYLQSTPSLVLQPTSVTPGAVVKVQPYSGVTGIQSWRMPVW